MARSKKYQEFLLEHLADHDEAVAYLNAALEESLKGDEESQQLFLIALRNVAEAQGGVGALAKKAHVGRESLQNPFRCRQSEMAYACFIVRCNGTEFKTFVITNKLTQNNSDL